MASGEGKNKDEQGLMILLLMYPQLAGTMIYSAIAKDYLDQTIPNGSYDKGWLMTNTYLHLFVYKAGNVETNIYYYDAHKESVEAVGKIDKSLAKAVINKEKNEITAVYVHNIDIVSGVVKYYIDTDTYEEKLNMEQIENLSDKEYWDISIFPNGREVIIQYREGGYSEVFLYDLETDSSQVIMEGKHIDYVQCLEQGEVLYVEANKLKIYNISSDTTQIVMEDFKYKEEIIYFELSNQRDSLVVMKRDDGNKQLYLYNIEKQKYKKILPRRLNIYYGTNFHWNFSDDYICYEENVGGFFSTGKGRALAYNVATREKTILYRSDEYIYERFEFLKEEK